MLAQLFPDDHILSHLVQLNSPKQRLLPWYGVNIIYISVFEVFDYEYKLDEIKIIYFWSCGISLVNSQMTATKRVITRLVLWLDVFYPNCTSLIYKCLQDGSASKKLIHLILKLRKKTILYENFTLSENKLRV